MTPGAQRIAIAEICGVSDIATRVQMGYWKIPDYPCDLNAMHEAEKVLMKPGLAAWCDYTRQLRRICGIALYAEIHATAAQRAEAFLRTLNLWTDEA